MSKDDLERTRERDRGRRGGGGARFASGDRDRSPDRGRDRTTFKSSSTSTSSAAAAASNCRVYVSNIPYEYRWQDLKDLFREQVGEVSFVELFVDEHEKARGCGIVEFVDAVAARKCLEVMHRFELKGRKIVIKEDYGNLRDKYGNLVGSGKRRSERDDPPPSRDRRSADRRGGGNNYDYHDSSSGGGGCSQIVGNTYGLSPAFLDDLNIQTPLISRVFVANLEYTVDKKKLKEVFRMAGKVVSVDMPVTKEGSSRGFAVIEYDHPVESVQAISMFNGQTLYERAMTVRMDRGPERDRLPDGLKAIGPGLGSNGEPLRDVARNLPSLIGGGSSGGGGGGGGPGGGVQQQQQQQSATVNSGPGLLGAMPNLQLNAAAASALGSALSSTSAAVLQQAASLGLPGNLLASDLNLAGAASLLQNNPSLAVLASGGFHRGGGGGDSSGNNPSGGGGGGGGGGSGFLSNTTSNNSNFGGQSMTRNSYQSGGGGGVGYESSKTNTFSFSSAGGDFGSANGGAMMRSSMLDTRKKNNKLLISNLPPTASYKLITEKCQEFGAVDDVEEQGAGSILVTFQTEWDAERAMKNIDRARIDGRAIDARIL